MMGNIPATVNLSHPNGTPCTKKCIKINFNYVICDCEENNKNSKTSSHEKDYCYLNG